jgi:hypothetical protein|tara:strand:- start:32 stop:160 length:129 start_codon:yes stop_codon:yes gene_type:complete
MIYVILKVILQGERIDVREIEGIREDVYVIGALVIAWSLDHV